MLPQTLLCLVSAILATAQIRQRLALESVTLVDARQNLRSFSFPSQQPLTVSVAVCASTSPTPRFFVTNGSDEDPDPGPAGGDNVVEIPLSFGQGRWRGAFPNGGVLAVDFGEAERVPFEVALSISDAVHQTATEVPYLGDSTANQVVLFSAPFEKIAVDKPSFPNYTLPSAANPMPQSPSSRPNFTLVLARTSANPDTDIRTGCFLSQSSPEGTIINETLWARDENGWRNQWIVGDLTPSTNYTAFVLQDTRKVSGPIYFATKSAAFPCSLVHSLPYCPSVAYSVPIPAPEDGSATYDASNLPLEVSEPIVSYLANFTTVLTTLACGRDWYSPIVGCDDCQREYRKWLCAISLTRCSEPSPGNSNGFTIVPSPPSATGIAAVKEGQRVFSALLPQSTDSTPRNPNLPSLGRNYNALLPCLEVCHAVDRACPPFVGFKCPKSIFNAAASYGVGYIDAAKGTKGRGVTGVAQDRWGNVWCAS